MSTASRDQIVNFWSLVDEVLNTLLFLLIGIEVLAIELDRLALLAMLLAIPLAIFVRMVCVTVPLTFLSERTTSGDQISRSSAIGILTWGGLRGGISVALALSLPASTYRGALLTVCYGLVVFTIVVQGLTMPWVIRRLIPSVAEVEPPSALAEPPAAS
jgi:CPA1 family monovalent cation:H+ antiporter